MTTIKKLKHLNIVVVEDSTEDALLLEHYLRKAGFEPLAKRVDTEEQYRRALSRDIDLIFSDFSLPTFSTGEALKILQETQLDIPFVIVSGTIGEERAVESLRNGATDYVLKDRIARLGPVVRRALAEAKDRRERQKAEIALRESETRFRQVTESIDEVCWLTDFTKTTMIYISPAYEKMWGRSRESWYADSQSWLDSIHPEDRERIRRLSEPMNQLAGKYDVEYRIIRPDDEIRWIHERAFPVLDADGKMYRITGVAQDITRHRRLEEQYRHAQKMEAVGQLAAGVAHDFNNLLTIIGCNAELLLAESNLTHRSKEGLGEIVAATDRAAKLTSQLLLFSRKKVMQSQATSLNEMISNIAKMFQRIIGADIALKFQSDDALPLVQADAAMIEQVLLNMVVNARDAMPRGGELHLSTTKVTVADPVQLSPRASGGEFVCLSLRDTGVGISAANQARIFEPFFTTKEPGKGTGLGLATTYGIIEQHQGWIDVESTVGVGTTFRVYLPALPESQTEFVKTSTDETMRSGTETVLLVEDDISVRFIVRRMLESFGYKVHEAGTGPEALAFWQGQGREIDLLITDVVMPGGMTGRELVVQLREQRPDLKAILISGYSPETAGKDSEAFRNTKTMFLQKPCPTKVLLQSMRELIEA
jgi:two-component system, cell cycle sensor histidine kinase and response regulator CckA